MCAGREVERGSLSHYQPEFWISDLGFRIYRREEAVRGVGACCPREGAMGEGRLEVSSSAPERALFYRHSAREEARHAASRGREGRLKSAPARRMPGTSELCALARIQN